MKQTIYINMKKKVATIETKLSNNATTNTEVQLKGDVIKDVQVLRMLFRNKLNAEIIFV